MWHAMYTLTNGTTTLQCREQQQASKQQLRLFRLACCASCAACAPRRPARDYVGDGADGPRTRLLQSQGAYQGVRSDLAAATQL